MLWSKIGNNPNVYKQMKKPIVVYPYKEYCLAIKRNELFLQTATSINLKIIMLSERS